MILLRFSTQRFFLKRSAVFKMSVKNGAEALWTFLSKNLLQLSSNLLQFRRDETSEAAAMERGHERNDARCRRLGPRVGTLYKYRLKQIFYLNQN
jgi:hypothetical protein